MKNIKDFMIVNESNIKKISCKKNKKIIIDIDKFKEVAKNTGAEFIELRYDWGECELSGSELDKCTEIQ